MSFFSAIIDSLSAYNEKRARELVARELSNMPARKLADLGFDSMLIAQGAKGWPWRLESKGELASLKMVWSSDSSINTRVALDEAVSGAHLKEEKNAKLQVAQAA